MADHTVSADVDAMLTAANNAAIRTAIGAAPLASPTFTGTPAAPTAAGGTNTTQIATTAFVQSALAGVVQVLEGEVATFADLPAAGAGNNGHSYFVRESQGVIFVNRKKAGIYTSDGAAWTLNGDATEAYFQDTLAWTNITSKPDAASQAEAEAGTEAGIRLFSPLRIAQAIATLGKLIKLDDFAAPDDNTDRDASTTAHGLLLKATAPGAGLQNIVAIRNGETAYVNRALFDTTNPEALGTVGPGSSLVAARRDHVHARQTAITEAEQTLADNTTNDVSTTKHGYVPKAPNDTTKFLRGDGTWAVPAGGGGGQTWATRPRSRILIANGTTVSNVGSSNTTSGTASGITASATFPTGARYTSVATTDNHGGWEQNGAYTHTGLLPTMRMLIALNTFALGVQRVFCGFSNAIATQMAGNDPATHSAVFRYSTAASDTNWQCITNDGSGGGTITDSGVAVTANPVTLAIEILSASVKFYIDGNLVATHSTNLPSAAVGHVIKVRTLENVSKAIDIAHCTVEET